MTFKSRLVLMVFGLPAFGASAAFAQSAAESQPVQVHQSCEAYDDFESVRCCTLGFTGDAFGCCAHHLAKDEDPGTPEAPASCEIIHPKPCDSVADPDLKACCEQHGGLTLDAVKECIPDQPEPAGDCNMIVNIGGDVNAPMNICCQIVNNGGAINGDVLQQCSNSFEPENPEPVDPCKASPDLPECQTASQGEAPPPEGSCIVTPGESADFVNGKLASISAGGSGVALVIRAVDLVKEPAAYVELKQVEGPLVTLEGSSESQAGELVVKTLNTKIGPFKGQPSWTAHMALPKSYIGEFIPDAKFTLSVYDVKSNLLAETTCAQKATIEAKGGAAGCSLIR